MLATALRLQVLKPHATLSCIGEALGGWSLSPHNLTSLLLVLKRRRRWRQALLLVEYAQASGVPLRTMHLNLAISACSRSAPRRALALFAQMGSGEGLAGGVAPDVVSFNAAMAAAAAAGDEERVHELLDTMKEAGLSPSGISYNTAISACARRGDWEGALSYFREMEQRQVARNTVTYTAAIDACARGGELQKAITLFTYMEARRRRQQTAAPPHGPLSPSRWCAVRSPASSATRSRTPSPSLAACAMASPSAASLSSSRCSSARSLVINESLTSD